MKPAPPRTPPAAPFISPPPVPAAWWNSFTARLAAVSAASGAIDAGTSRTLASLVTQLAAPEVTVVFGGYFSAGKSSLVNCALGRPLLPVDDLPETGAACVLRAGARDEAVVVETGKRRLIPCNRDAIRSTVGLWQANGENKDVQRIARLELRLAGFPAPANVRWIDSPGIASGTESRRALLAADEGDLLVWVLKGAGQFLSETEIATLAGHVQRRGPASVVFVMNAFLSRDTPEGWDKFLRERLLAHQQRLRDYLATMGFAVGRPPPLVVVSARAAAGNQASYGGPELRRLIAALGAADAPLIRRARLGRAALELHRLKEALRPQLTSLATDNRAREQRRDAEEAELAQRRRRFLAAAEAALARFFLDFATVAEESANTLAAAINSNSLKRDDTYGRELSRLLRSEYAGAFSTLCLALDEAARSEEQGAAANGEDRLHALLAPADVTVQVPDHSIGKGGVLAGAAAGAAAGTLVPVVGTLIGALAGAVTGAVVQGNAALGKDVAGAQANVRAAATAAVAALRAQRSRALELIDRSFFSSAPTAPPPDTARQRRLGDFVTALTALADAAGGPV